MLPGPPRTFDSKKHNFTQCLRVAASICALMLGEFILAIDSFGLYSKILITCSSRLNPDSFRISSCGKVSFCEGIMISNGSVGNRGLSISGTLTWQYSKFLKLGWNCLRMDFKVLDDKAKQWLKLTVLIDLDLHSTSPHLLSTQLQLAILKTIKSCNPERNPPRSAWQCTSLFWLSFLMCIWATDSCWCEMFCSETDCKYFMFLIAFRTMPSGILNGTTVFIPKDSTLFNLEIHSRVSHVIWWGAIGCKESSNWGIPHSFICTLVMQVHFAASFKVWLTFRTHLNGLRCSSKSSLCHRAQDSWNAMTGHIKVFMYCWRDRMWLMTFPNLSSLSDIKTRRSRIYHFPWSSSKVWLYVSKVFSGYSV